ncbi:MAG: hypothetical protein V7603_3992 [Micromonosporaceae bacterium]
MSEPTPGFIDRLKSSIAVDIHAPLVLLGNFEVETCWARGELGLPSVGFASSNLVVNRMDEFAMLLAGPDDVAVVKGHPDPDHLAHLADLRFGLPRLIVADGAPERTVTDDGLRDPAVVEALSRLAPSGAAILPHGVSDDEERLATTTGLPLAAPTAQICKAVNSKVYSRRLADRLGLRQPCGRACDDTASWVDAVALAHGLLAGGARLAVKDAYGVSGRGISVLDDGRRLDQLDRMVRGRLRRAGTDRIGLVVEEWVPKAADLNYQFTVSRDGQVRFDFVKEAVTDNGVHKGHRMPARLTGAQDAELIAVAEKIGAALAEDGYFGVVGVDAMIDPSGGLYPVVEINARNNMSTYQVRLWEEVVGVGQVALARHYPVRLTRPLPFGRVRDLLAGLLLNIPGGEGLLVNNYATVNAALSAAKPGQPVEGRLYGLVVADDMATVDRLDEEIARRLAGSCEGVVR